MKRKLDYFETTANDPLEVVNEILRSLTYRDRSEIEFYDERTSRTININREEEYVSPMSFCVTLYKEDGTYHSLAGTIINRGTNDHLRPVWDAGAEMEQIEIC